MKIYSDNNITKEHLDEAKATTDKQHQKLFMLVLASFGLNLIISIGLRFL